MKKLFYLTVVILLMGLSFDTSAQVEKFKALFMYNFIKSIDWPANLKQGDFVIGVLGTSPIYKELETIAKTKKTGTQTMVIKTFTSVSEISQCHIIYLPSGKSDKLKEVLLKVTGKNSLVITDKKGLAKEGAGINYTMDGDKINFEINKANIEKCGLKVSSSLLSLGTVIQ